MVECHVKMVTIGSHVIAAAADLAATTAVGALSKLPLKLLL